MARPIKIRDQGFHHQRTNGESSQAKREKAFAEEWKGEAGEILPQLFIPNHRRGKTFDLLGMGEPILTPNRLHRAMIATIIQWQGSNVGFSFLERVLSRCGYSVIKTNDLQRMRKELVDLKMKSSVK